LVDWALWKHPLVLGGILTAVVSLVLVLYLLLSGGPLIEVSPLSFTLLGGALVSYSTRVFLNRD